MLLKEAEEFGKFVVIAGLKDVKITNVDMVFDKIRNKTEAHVQIFNAAKVAGWQHIYFATLNALKAFHDKSELTHGLATEAILYASGQRQIQRSFDMLGVMPKTRNVAVLIIASSENEVKTAFNIVSEILGGKPDDDVMRVTDEKYVTLKKLFEITDKEVEAKAETKNAEKEALTYLIIERGALLRISK